MRLLLTLARAYPGQSATLLLALLLAGIVEGVSLSALLPLVGTAVGQETAAAGELVTGALAAVGVAPTLGVLLLVIVAGITLKNVLLLLANKRVGYTVAQVATDLRLALLRALLATRWEYYLKQPIGSLANAMSTEVIRASGAYHTGATMIALAIQGAAYGVVAWLISWQVTLVSLVIGLVLLLALQRLVRMARRAGKRQTQLLKSLLVRLADTLQSIKPLKAMAREDLADAVLAAETGRLNRALQREVLSREMLTSAHEPMFAAVIAVGMYVSLAHWELPLATVLVQVLLLARVLATLSRVQRHYQKMVVGESAYWSLQETIRSAGQAREPASGDGVPRLERAIRLERVCFGYGAGRVLREVSLTLPAGSFTVLVGPSGEGKTTLADLIAGLLQPQAGTIRIDDVALERLDRRRWRRLIGYVPQENLLLHDTILTNVTLGDPALGAADAEYGLRAAGAWEFVAALPQGLHTPVGERGARLSGGQRQRIMIARALAHRPALLILDEATSALDPETEALICRTLQQLRGRLTILAISHQPALVEAADRVYRLQDGSAVLLTEPMTAAPERAAVG